MNVDGTVKEDVLLVHAPEGVTVKPISSVAIGRIGEGLDNDGIHEFAFTGYPKGSRVRG